MLDDLIIETEPIDTTNLSENLSEEEKVVIDEIESMEIIKFNLMTNYISFCNKYGSVRNYWNLKFDKIYKILRDKYSCNEQQINDLVKDILMNHYKIKVTRTSWTPYQNVFNH